MLNSANADSLSVVDALLLASARQLFHCSNELPFRVIDSLFGLSLSSRSDQRYGSSSHQERGGEDAHAIHLIVFFPALDGCRENVKADILRLTMRQPERYHFAGAPVSCFRKASGLFYMLSVSHYNAWLCLTNVAYFAITSFIWTRHLLISREFLFVRRTLLSK